jgi:hypothetical protein
MCRPGAGGWKRVGLRPLVLDGCLPVIGNDEAPPVLALRHRALFLLMESCGARHGSILAAPGAYRNPSDRPRMRRASQIQSSPLPSSRGSARRLGFGRFATGATLVIGKLRGGSCCREVRCRCRLARLFDIAGARQRPAALQHRGNLPRCAAAWPRGPCALRRLHAQRLRRADHLRANLRRLYLSRLSYGTALVSEKAVSLTPAIAFTVLALIVPRRVRYTSIPSITRWT